MPNLDPPSPKSKVTRLPTELTHLFERTLASHDADGDVDVASNLRAEDSKTEPLVQDLVDKIRGEILEAAIGLGFLLVGIAVFVALAVLPHKPGLWLFIVAAVVLMFAGGRRIDAATHAHRLAKHSKSRRAQ